MTTREIPTRSSSLGEERQPLRVLLVEDSADDALLLLRELKRGGYEVFHERVDTAECMRAALEGQDWDVVVSDHAMPTFSAPAALELLRENGWREVPFIIVSGHIGEEAAVKAMKAGAHDFIAKDSLARLVPAIERELRDAEERRERRRAQEALREAEEKYRGIFENAVEGIFQTTVDGRFIMANPMMARIYGYDSPEELVRTLQNVEEQLYVEPDRRNDLIRLMQRDGRVFEFEAQFYRKDGTKIWVSMNARAVRSDSGEIVSFEGTLEDITERKRAEEELRRSLDRLMALHEAGNLLNSTLEPEEIATRLLGIMRRISGLTAAVISLREDGGQLGIWRSIGLERLEPTDRSAPAVKEAQEAALESETSRLFRLDAQANESVAVGLCLPLLVRERAVGVLEVYGPEALAENDVVEILESLTSQAASAFENARLYGELAEREKRLQDLVGKILVAQEEERRRVAYEVHDGLAQVAAAAHQHLQAFTQYHPPKSDEGRKDLTRVSELVRQTVGEARRIIANLRPTALDDFGLKSAVRLHLDALRAEGWHIEYEETLGDERLPAATETAIFRVIQEALNNVGKHAGTNRVDLSLERRPAGTSTSEGERGSIRLTVRDYGRGFVPEESSARGAPGGPGERVGLTGMRERVALLGGDFRVASRPGVGTIIVAEIPLLAGPTGGSAGDIVGRPADVPASDPSGGRG
ncbi:MAG: PAS domain S-box protein [Actinomycetota bacterium]|nr:PAS domain S-box protein [Actinomycetota bacterium]